MTLAVAETLEIATRRSVPELLAPAGDWEAMRAAVANGADAVYFGLDQFNARHRAANFDIEELPEIMSYLHGHNVKGFLTFNTLIFSDELVEAAKYIGAIARAGVDAVIVQDLGLVRLIGAIAPTLHMHGSTQMTLTEARGIEFVRGLGVQRVVLARELSVDDIRKIAGATPMPLEVFVHGALCVAYSGQCLTSEALGGRSANRGQCAQACRLPYELMVDGQKKDLGERAYLLSPQDLAGHELIGELAELGVASLKIEGRLKSAHYVAAATQTYRQALGSAQRGECFKINPQQRGDLEQTFSRGFTNGFLNGVNHQKLVVGRFPKSRGRRVGVVKQVMAGSVLIDLEGADVGLKLGDGVVFDEGHPEQDEQGGRVFAVRPSGLNRIEIELRRGDVNLSAIAEGSIVWKTDDPGLRKRLEHSFSREAVANRLRVRVEVRAHVGERLSVRIEDGGNVAAMEWDRTLERALKFPFTREIAIEQLGRLGDSPYELGELHFDVSGEPMVPKSVLNDLRRRAVALLLEQRNRLQIHEVIKEDALAPLRTEALSASPISATGSSLYVLVRSLEQLDGVLNWVRELRPAMVYCDFEDVRRYREAVERCRGAAMPVALATLRVVKPGEEGFLRQISDAAPDALLVRNLAAVSFYREQTPNLPLIGDYSLNISNELTAKLFAHAGLLRMVPSYDLNWQQMQAMVSRFAASAFEIVVHQHMPMFHMEHCVFAHTLSKGKDFRDCGRPCERHQVDLRDRVGEPHPLIPDVGCRNTVFNARAQSAAEFIPRMKQLGLVHFRIELLREKADEVGPILDRYANILSGKQDAKSALRSLRVLNQLGVTRGTLDRE